VIAFAPALLVTAIGGDTHRHVLSVSVHVRHRIRSRAHVLLLQAKNEDLPSNLCKWMKPFGKFCWTISFASSLTGAYRSATTNIFGSYRVRGIPKSLSVSSLRGEHASSPAGSKKTVSRLACYSSGSRLSHAPATGHSARNRRS
jgi:hypothetical protein